MCRYKGVRANRQTRSSHYFASLLGVEWLKLASVNQSNARTHAISHLADLPGRRSLRFAWTNCLLVPSVKLSTVGGRAFPVAGPTIWNSLPDNVICAPSLSTFCQRLKT